MCAAREDWELHHCSTIAYTERLTDAPNAVRHVLQAIQHQQLVSIRSIVDVGCGTSAFADRLHRTLESRRTVGIDWSMAAIAFARMQFRNVQYKEIDVLQNQQSRTDARFDLVVSKSFFSDVKGKPDKSKLGEKIEAMINLLNVPGMIVAIEHKDITQLIADALLSLEGVLVDVSFYGKNYNVITALKQNLDDLFERKMIENLEENYCKFDIVSAITKYRSFSEGTDTMNFNEAQQVIIDIIDRTGENENYSLEDRVDDVELCRVCFDTKINSCLIPCGHLCSCYDCSIELLRCDYECPVCRSYIDKIVRVFRVPLKKE